MIFINWVECIGGDSIKEYTNEKGQRHRENGPALIHYNLNRAVIEERYYLNGKELSEENYCKLMIIN